MRKFRKKCVGLFVLLIPKIRCIFNYTVTFEWQDDYNLIQADDLTPTYENGTLTCKFRRPIKTYVSVQGKPIEFDLERGKYYVIMAAGNLHKPDSG